jgi:hypothetical protein
MSSDERREVAERVRTCGQTVKGTKYFFMYLANCVDTPSEDLDADDTFCLQRNRRVAERTMEKLADLIDPTCEVVGSEPLYMDDETEFRLSCGHAAEMTTNEPPAYCPECGARVTGGDVR